MRYMIIVKATPDSEKGVFPPHMAELMEAMDVFHKELAQAGVLLDAAGLKPSSQGWRIRYGGKERKVIDGPFAEAKEMVGGFFLIDCKSRAEAVAIAQACPAAEWCTVEVRGVGPCYEDTD